MISSDFSLPMRGLEFWRSLNLGQKFHYKIDFWSPQCEVKQKADRNLSTKRVIKMKSGSGSSKSEIQNLDRRDF